MATPIAKNTHPVFRTSTMGAVCKTRTNLLDRLAGALESLGRAKLSLETESPDDDSSDHHQNMRNRVDGLRHECGIIRRELEFHRITHGC